MGVLSDLQPTKVFQYFEDICGIPHSSGNTKQISDYCVSFAKEHNLKYSQDSYNNVVIWKNASKGYENAPTVILQGHLDMVCEKTADCEIDFDKEGLALQTDGELIYAKGTTLGADDGIAVAYTLAILDDDTLMHPAIEAVFTVDEEIGMLGAQAFDFSQLKGTLMLNVDSEEEGILLGGCAGGVRGICTLPMEYKELTGTAFEICIDGLLGGHSGEEINKYRANANKVMGRLLHGIGAELPFGIKSLAGGLKDNAIPRKCEAVIVTNDSEETDLYDTVAKLEIDIKKEFEQSDPDLSISIKKAGSGEYQVLTPKSKEILVFFLVHIPDGVQKMNLAIPGLVQTSLNLGIMELTDTEFQSHSSIRSSVTVEKSALSEKLEYLTQFFGGEYDTQGDYPAWEYYKESKLRPLMVAKYKEMFGNEPEVKVIHAGLECGIFFEKLESVDIVSMGPDIFDIHTPKERMPISSAKKTYEYLLEVLKAIQ